MRSVVVTGVGGPVGRRLAVLLGPATIDRIVGLDLRLPSVRQPNLELVTADLVQGDLTRLFDGSDSVVHLAWSLPSPRRQASAPGNVEATRRVLEAAHAAGSTSLVYLSSATVYGAWPDNPVPLTEEAPLRPNPGVGDAVHHAEAERLVGDWADAHPSASVAILRPATILGPGVDTWLSRALGGQAGLRPNGTEPARQFVHADDVAAAVRLAVVERLDGVYNVSADGSAPGEVVRELSAGRVNLPVPSRLAGAAARWAWALRLSELPPGFVPLIEHSWVMANDKLRSAGWVPDYTNEEVVVAGRPGSWWREMGPGRRQQVTLAGSAAVVAGGAAAVAGILAARRARRGRASGVS